ncbi:MAG: hypothetical protein GY920_21130 [Aliivibrio sp.]|nr:hypothetical protein [Aliivibrio sp.]MCP4323344.1 hypothetical protein [Alteromonadales bacterium]
MIEVFENGEWVEKQPEHKDKYRKTESRSVIISYWRDFDEEPKEVAE